MTRYQKHTMKRSTRWRKNPATVGQLVQSGSVDSPFYYKVVAVHPDGTVDLYSTGSGQTFRKVHPGGLRDSRSLQPVKNPSAVYGAFRANPEIPDVVRRSTYGFPVAGKNVRITAADLYPLASPADKARIERLCREKSSYSGEYGDVLSCIWERLGWPMPGRKNPKRNPSAVYGAFRAYNPRRYRNPTIPIEDVYFPSPRHVSGWTPYRLVQRAGHGLYYPDGPSFFAPSDEAAQSYAPRLLFKGATAIRLERGR